MTFVDPAIPEGVYQRTNGGGLVWTGPVPKAIPPEPVETLRDRFAMAVAQGLCAFSGSQGGSYGPGDIAKRAGEIADACMAEREGKL